MNTSNHQTTSTISLKLTEFRKIQTSHIIVHCHVIFCSSKIPKSNKNATRAGPCPPFQTDRVSCLRKTPRPIPERDISHHDMEHHLSIFLPQNLLGKHGNCWEHPMAENCAACVHIAKSQVTLRLVAAPNNQDLYASATTLLRHQNGAHGKQTQLSTVLHTRLTAASISHCNPSNKRQKTGQHL